MLETEVLNNFLKRFIRVIMDEYINKIKEAELQIANKSFCQGEKNIYSCSTLKKNQIYTANLVH